MYNVIIIEDDPMVASINKQYVELNKYMRVVATFSNGKEALDYLRDHPVDLAILDIYMPIMDGVALLTEIRQVNREIDIIVVTAASDSSHIRDCLSLGILDYMVKPFEYVRFNHALAKFIQHREVLNQPNVIQEDIDSLLLRTAPAPEKQKTLSKGLQDKTLNMLLNYMQQHRNERLTSERISEEVHLSQVTVRRYMNYLLEQQEIVSDIDYNTGGRPSMIYTYKGKNQ